MKYKLTALVMLLLLSFSILAPPNASAFTTEPAQTTPFGFDLWNWPYMVSHYNEYCTGTCPSFDDFDADSSEWSYIIFLNDETNNANTQAGEFYWWDQPKNQMARQFRIIAAPKGAKLLVGKDASGNSTIDFSGTASTIGYAGTLTSYNGVNVKTTFQTGPDVYGGFSKDPGTSSGSIASIKTAFNTTHAIWVAHGVEYAPTWNFKQYQANPQYGTKGAGQSCSAVNVGCWIGKAVNGLQDTLAGWFTGLANFFNAIFIPDSTATKAKFDDLNTFMSAKLGFILYPFTFLVSLVNALGNPTGACTVNTCVLSGNFSLGTMNLDLLYMKSQLPSAWSWFTLAIRAMTVLLLANMLLTRFKEVTQK